MTNAEGPEWVDDLPQGVKARYAGRGRPRVWESLLTPLLDRPGQWAIVREYDRPESAEWAARKLRHAGRRPRGTPNLLVIPPGRFDFISGNGRLYARYLGPDDG